MMPLPTAPIGGIAGAPPLPPPQFNQGDRQFLAALTERIDTMIAEIEAAQTRMEAEFSGDPADARLRQTFARLGVPTAGPAVIGDRFMGTLNSVYPFDPSGPGNRLLENNIDFEPGARQRNAEFIRNVGAFYERYSAQLTAARDGLEARIPFIAQQMRLTSAALTPQMRAALEGDVEYLESGHELWRSLEADLTQSLLPSYQERLFLVSARMAQEGQLAAARLQVWADQIVARYPAYRTADFEARRQIENDVVALSDRDSPAYQEHAACAFSLGVWGIELVQRPTVSPPITIYMTPAITVSHLGGSFYARPYETDALVPDLRAHLQRTDPCDTAPEMDGAPQLRIAVWQPREIVPEPPVLDEDGLSTPLPEGIYTPVEEIFYGHPFFVEAIYDERQNGDNYAVTVGGLYSVIVERTEENPFLYRSRAVVLTHGGLVAGATP